MLTSKDQVTQHVASRSIQSQDPAGDHRRVVFKPMAQVRNVLAVDPGCALVQRSKGLLAMEDADKRLDHTKSLPRQGQLLRDTADAAAEVWSTAVGTLSSMTMN